MMYKIKVEWIETLTLERASINLTPVTDIDRITAGIF